jgi:hypothetical protein
MAARPLASLAVRVGSLPTLAAFALLAAAGGAPLLVDRLPPGVPRAAATVLCDAVAFTWIWSVGAVAARARDGALGAGAVAWAAVAAATALLRGWIELADPVTLRLASLTPQSIVTLAGVTLLVITSFGLPIWAAVRLGAVRPEPWRWIDCAGGAVLLVFSPLGVVWVQPWLHALLADAPSVRH